MLYSCQNAYREWNISALVNRCSSNSWALASPSSLCPIPHDALGLINTVHAVFLPSKLNWRFSQEESRVEKSRVEESRGEESKREEKRGEKRRGEETRGDERRPGPERLWRSEGELVGAWSCSGGRRHLLFSITHQSLQPSQPLPHCVNNHTHTYYSSKHIYTRTHTYIWCHTHTHQPY